MGLNNNQKLSGLNIYIYTHTHRHLLRWNGCAGLSEKNVYLQQFSKNGNFDETYSWLTGTGSSNTPICEIRYTMSCLKQLGSHSHESQSVYMGIWHLARMTHLRHSHDRHAKQQFHPFQWHSVHAAGKVYPFGSTCFAVVVCALFTSLAKCQHRILWLATQQGQAPEANHLLNVPTLGND